MLTIGLTGGIGSGKSTVAEMFRELGAPILDSDVVAREVVEPGTEGLKAVRERFGDDVVQADGGLNRAALRRRIFADEGERRALEGLLHPRIIARMRAWAQPLRAPYCIMVIPLLVESRLGHLVDRILVVDAPVEEQRRRAAVRDTAEAGDIDRVIAAQASRAERLAQADDVVRNDGDLNALREQVLALHQRYLDLAAGREPAPE